MTGHCITTCCLVAMSHAQQNASWPLAAGKDTVQIISGSHTISRTLLLIEAGSFTVTEVIYFLAKFSVDSHIRNNTNPQHNVFTYPYQKRTSYPAKRKFLQIFISFVGFSKCKLWRFWRNFNLRTAVLSRDQCFVRPKILRKCVKCLQNKIPHKRVV